MTITATLVANGTETCRYNMPCDWAIIDDAEGRLLIREGWGGQDGIQGGMYRWRHGAAYRLQPGDTWESLKAGEWNECNSLLDAVCHGYDTSRPMLNWSGQHISSLAQSLGL